MTIPHNSSERVATRVLVWEAKREGRDGLCMWERWVPGLLSSRGRAPISIVEWTFNEPLINHEYSSLLPICLPRKKYHSLRPFFRSSDCYLSMLGEFTERKPLKQKLFAPEFLDMSKWVTWGVCVWVCVQRERERHRRNREREERESCQRAGFRRKEDYTLHCSRVTERKRGWHQAGSPILSE